jgi:hypothetical protein
MLLTMIMIIVAIQVVMVATMSELVSPVHIIKLKMKIMNMTISIDENDIIILEMIPRGRYDLEILMS